MVKPVLQSKLLKSFVLSKPLRPKSSAGGRRQGLLPYEKLEYKKQ